jgi:threonine synthase
VSDDTPVISLGEGNTPLLKLNNIPKHIGKDVEIYVKYEGLNPTGSFKDRGMTMAVTKAVEAGSKAIICASTGNTSAAAAAYAARAGITAFVLIPDGKIALGKLAQAMMHNAVVIQIKGNFDEGMQLVKEVAEHAPVTIVNSINPFRLQGQKTAAFEVVEELGRAPDFHCLPVGNAGNITAHWIGYSEYATSCGDHVTDSCALCHGDCQFTKEAVVKSRPKMIGYQAAGSAPFMRGEMVDNPETVATAIRIGHPQSWDMAWKVKEESQGWFDECDDETILAAQKLLAEKEGIFCEPASATSVAGALRDIESGKIPEGSVVVCTLTGHGLKDPDIAIKQSSSPLITVEAKLDAVRDAILGNMAK